MKDIKIFLKKKKKKNDNIGMKDIKISLKMKNKGWFSIGKIIIIEKTFHDNTEHIIYHYRLHKPLSAT